MSFASAKTAINQNLDKINTVTVAYSGHARGAPPPAAPSQGVLIYRDGVVKTGSISGDFSIILEGGNSAWVGAISPPNAAPFVTPAQQTILWQLVDYIQTMNASIDIDIQV